METKIRKGIMTQIGILTRDIERSKAAWEAFFGLPPQPINESDGYEKTQATLKLMNELAKGRKSGEEKGWLTLEAVEEHLGIAHE